MPVSEYHLPPQQWEPSRHKPPRRRLHDHHRRMLEDESGISPAEIAARGYWTETDPSVLKALGYADYQCRPEMGPFLVIPEWTTAGVQRGSKIRPDHPRLSRPRLGKKPKPIKYESPAGSRLQVDCPPTVTHLLRDPSVTLYITEGSKKADAAASRGLLCLSFSGVYGFMHQRLVISDLDDIALIGRTVRIFYDRDVTSNRDVAAALNRIAAAFDRRGATVEIGHLPVAGDAKGLDDYFAAGHTVADLDSLCRSWHPPTLPPSEVYVDGDPYVEIDRLRKIVSAQADLLRNPHLKDKPRMVGFATITEAASKISRGDVEPDGRVRLEVSRIVNDFRPRPAKGEATPETNPQDGSFPLTSRDNAKSALKHLAQHGAIDAEFVPVKRQHASGDWYVDSELLVRIPDVTGALRQLASYSNRTGRKAYTRQDACPACGGVHPRSVRTIHEATCHGCGAIITTEDPVRIVPVPLSQRPNITEKQRARLDTITSAPSPGERASGKNLEAERPVKASGSPAPVNSVSGKNLEAPGPAQSAGGLWRPPDDQSVDICTTMGCRNPISPHWTYICDECATHLEVAS